MTEIRLIDIFLGDIKTYALIDMYKAEIIQLSEYDNPQDHPQYLEISKQVDEFFIQEAKHLLGSAIR